MGALGAWIREWRETYREYPGATVVTWVEMLLAVGLMVFSVVFIVGADQMADVVGLAFLTLGLAFATWFVLLRPPVMDRLVAE